MALESNFVFHFQGATIVDQIVSITRADNYVPKIETRVSYPQFCCNPF